MGEKLLYVLAIIITAILLTSTLKACESQNASDRALVELHKDGLRYNQ